MSFFAAGGCLFAEVTQRDANGLESVTWDPSWQNSNCSKVSSHHILWPPPVFMQIMTSVPFTFSYTIRALGYRCIHVWMCMQVDTHTHTPGVLN